MRPLLEMRNVFVRRGLKGVLDIDELILRKGELTSIIGPNGAGKSTLLQVINLLLPIDAGVIKLYGEEIGKIDTRELRRRCGLVFQEPLLVKDTVYNNVALPLKLRGVPHDEVEARVAAALESFRCSHLVNRLAHYLSGGEAQRVSLARALVSKPELLLLDEPFTALDPSTRSALTAELRQVAREHETTIVFVSHSLSDVLDFTERAIVLQNGRIVQDDSPEIVLRRPATAEVAKLVGMDNILPCKVELDGSGLWAIISDDIRFRHGNASQGKEMLCCLPGDVFRVSSGELPDESAWVAFWGTVRQVIPGVGVYQALIESGGLVLNIKVSRDQAKRYLNTGAKVRLAFDPLEAQLVASSGKKGLT